MTAREAAFLSLQKMRGSGRYANIELSGSLDRFALSDVEKAFYTALFYGVIEREITLDYLIAQFSDRKIDDLDRDVRTILQIGLYQLVYMDKVPESAAVNESVKLARRFYARKNSEGFINAVLRSYLRGKEGVVFPDPKKDFIRYLSVTYSLPEWMCRHFTDAYGKARAEQIAEQSLSHPTMTLRANTLRTTRDELISSLINAGIACEKSRAPYGVTLKNHVPMEKLTPFDGLFFVQDEASQLAVEAIGAKPGETVLDCCACPGGKSFGIALSMENRGRVLSYDLHENKLSLIRRTAETLGLSILEIGVGNASVYNDAIPTVDRLLCDVPCSGLGVIAKKPDIRYKRQEDILRLPALQLAILENASRYVKDGGEIVYSTCTLNPAENTETVTAFLTRHPEYELCPFTAGALHSDGMTELLPTDRNDGFFIAKLRKKEQNGTND